MVRIKLVGGNGAGVHRLLSKLTPPLSQIPSRPGRPPQSGWKTVSNPTAFPIAPIVTPASRVTPLPRV